MELGVLDPCEYDNYGSQLLIGYIDDIENHNSCTSAFRFDASGKGTYGQWGAWLMSSGGGWHGGGQGGRKMEEVDDGG